MSYETVIFERRGAVAEIVLNRPRALNAFDATMHRELYDALGRAAEDEGVRALLLRGEGRAFSSGADLKDEGVRGEDGSLADLGDYLRRTYSRTVLLIASMEKPVVAALGGVVYGAGVGIALSCDLRVAAEDARISVAFVNIGLMPDAGTTFFLPRVVGLGRAMELSLLGDEIGAEEAARIGLVNRVVPAERLLEEARSLSERLAAMPTRALGETRRALRRSFESGLEEALEREAEGQSSCGRTRDFEEGVQAFFERRDPRFTGR